MEAVFRAVHRREVSRDYINPNLAVESPLDVLLSADDPDRRLLSETMWAEQLTGKVPADAAKRARAAQIAQQQHAAAWDMLRQGRGASLNRQRLCRCIYLAGMDLPDTSPDGTLRYSKTRLFATNAGGEAQALKAALPTSAAAAPPPGIPRRGMPLAERLSEYVALRVSQADVFLTVLNDDQCLALHQLELELASARGTDPSVGLSPLQRKLLKAADPRLTDDVLERASKGATMADTLNVLLAATQEARPSSPVSFIPPAAWPVVFDTLLRGAERQGNIQVAAARLTRAYEFILSKLGTALLHRAYLLRYAAADIERLLPSGSPETPTRMQKLVRFLSEERDAQDGRDVTTAEGAPRDTYHANIADYTSFVVWSVGGTQQPQTLRAAEAAVDAATAEQSQHIPGFMSAAAARVSIMRWWDQSVRSVADQGPAGAPVAELVKVCESVLFEAAGAPSSFLRAICDNAVFSFVGHLAEHNMRAVVQQGIISQAKAGILDVRDEARRGFYDAYVQRIWRLIVLAERTSRSQRAQARNNSSDMLLAFIDAGAHVAEIVRAAPSALLEAQEEPGDADSVDVAVARRLAIEHIKWISVLAAACNILERAWDRVCAYAKAGPVAASSAAEFDAALTAYGLEPWSIKTGTADVRGICIALAPGAPVVAGDAALGGTWRAALELAASERVNNLSSRYLKPLTATASGEQEARAADDLYIGSPLDVIRALGWTRLHAALNKKGGLETGAGLPYIPSTYVAILRRVAKTGLSALAITAAVFAGCAARAGALAPNLFSVTVTSLPLRQSGLSSAFAAACAVIEPFVLGMRDTFPLAIASAATRKPYQGRFPTADAISDAALGTALASLVAARSSQPWYKVIADAALFAAGFVGSSYIIVSRLLSTFTEWITPATTPAALSAVFTPRVTAIIAPLALIIGTAALPSAARSIKTRAVRLFDAIRRVGEAARVRRSTPVDVQTEICSLFGVEGAGADERIKLAQWRAALQRDVALAESAEAAPPRSSSPGGIALGAMNIVIQILSVCVRLGGKVVMSLASGTLVVAVLGVTGYYFGFQAVSDHILEFLLSSFQSVASAALPDPVSALKLACAWAATALIQAVSARGDAYLADAVMLAISGAFSAVAFA